VEVFDGAAVTEAGFEVGTPVVAPEDADTGKLEHTGKIKADTSNAYLKSRCLQKLEQLQQD